MSKATKRKYVTKEVQEDLRIPSEGQSIVKLVDSRGNNLHEVVDELGERYLVSMPVKFRRNVWVKRGNYVLVEKIAEGDKVKAEIVNILTRNHIKLYKSEDCWPKAFEEKEASDESIDVITRPDNENESSDDDDIFVNTNRQPKNLDGSRDARSSTESSESD